MLRLGSATKQNLVIKKLWGHSENVVIIHIWIAIIAYLLIVYKTNNQK